VKSVTGLVRFYARKQRQAHEREVANQVQRFVAAKFVVEPQWAIHHTIVGQHNRVIERTAANQPHGPKRFNFPFETEGTRPRQQLAKAFLTDVHFELLLANEGMGEIHEALHMKFGGGVDANAPAIFDDFERLQDFQVTPPFAQTARAGLLEHLHEWLGRAIEDGHLDGVNIDKHIVYAAGVDRCQKMLSGGQEDALFHQAGGVADAGDVFPARLDDEIVQVRTSKHDAGIGRCRNQADMAKDSGMETDALGTDFTLNSGLEHSILL